MSSIIDANNQSMDLVKRFADCLLEDSTNEADIELVKRLSSFILYFNNEIKINYKREQIFENFSNMISSATQKPDGESTLNQFHRELEKAEKQFKKNENCEEYKNFMEKISNAVPRKNENDIEIVTQTVTNIDPISKLPIQDPVKNKKCGHVYDKSSILKLLMQNPKMRCPIPGCNASGYVKESDLISDNTLKRMLSNMSNCNVTKKLRTVE